MKKGLIVVFAIILNAVAGYATQYTVSTVTDLKTAITNAVAGDVILINGGEYVFSARLDIKSKNGTATNKITIMGNPASLTRPRFNFSAMAEASANQGVLIQNCNYILIKGIDIYKAGDNGMLIQNSSDNIIEFCTFSECSDTGLQLDNGSANNIILNCDSYYNADASVENADGFAAKLNVGSGNTFKGCRAWQNLDDGWDGYLKETDNVNTFYENCWSFNNGKLKNGNTSGGDGNGFKSGGSDNKDLKHNATYKYCISVGNVKKGFDHNSNRGEVTLLNCAAYSNTQSNMGFGSTNPLGKLTIKNTLVFGTTGDTNAAIKDITNDSWNSSPAIAVTSTDFESVTIADLAGARKADGSLPDINFLRPKSNSALINKGVDVGLPYKGTAPDIGAFEYDPALPLTLLSFDAQAQKGVNPAIKLVWTTTNEVNTKDFDVFRKGESGAFEKIFTELAINQAGIHQYSYTDKLPLNGNNYYQLKQNDLDGKSTLSDIVIVKVGLSVGNKLSVYPNPATDWVTLNHPTNSYQSIIKITDARGKLVATYPIAPNQTQSNINITQLVSGVYVLSYKSGNNEEHLKIIKM